MPRAPRMTKKPESSAERRRAELQAVRNMCAELGIDEAELLRRTRDSLEHYRQQQRKRAGPPLRLQLRLHLAEDKPDGD
jgi:hypothetical protein